MHGRGWFLRTGSIAAATGLLVAIVVATTVGASPLYLLQSTYKADEGVFWTYKGGPVELAATPKKVASLKPPPGSYMVVAKLWADPAPSAGGKMNVFARCLLLAGPPNTPGSDGDISVLNLSKALVPGNTAAGTLAMTLAHKVRKGESISLICDDNGSGAQAHDIKITAIRARSLQAILSP